MGASDKSSEPRKSTPAPAAPAAPGAETTESMEAQTNRLNAEAVKLVAEANESRVRQLKDLEALLASFQRNLCQAERLKQLDQDLRDREAKAFEQAQSEHNQADAARRPAPRRPAGDAAGPRRIRAAASATLAGGFPRRTLARVARSGPQPRRNRWPDLPAVSAPALRRRSRTIRPATDNGIVAGYWALGP